MKYLIIILSIATSLNSFAQEMNYKEKTITGVFQDSTKTKSELFSSINKWIVLN
jgi:hypothetical protein